MWSGARPHHAWLRRHLFGRIARLRFTRHPSRIAKRIGTREISASKIAAMAGQARHRRRPARGKAGRGSNPGQDPWETIGGRPRFHSGPNWPAPAPNDRGGNIAIVRDAYVDGGRKRALFRVRVRHDPTPHGAWLSHPCLHLLRSRIGATTRMAAISTGRMKFSLEGGGVRSRAVVPKDYPPRARASSGGRLDGRGADRPTTR